MGEPVVPGRPGPTAQFSNLPATHDGATAFEVTLSFSEAPGLDEETVRDALLDVSCTSASCATVTGASRVTDREWRVTVEPSQAYDITLTVPVRACGETGAVCIDGRALAGPASATIPGRALTATLTHMPNEGNVKGEHKGSGTFEVRLAFNTELLDAPAQRRPVALGGIEVPSQIEQGALAHFVADAFGAHESVSEVGLAGGGGAGLGAPDEHGTQGSGRRGVVQYLKYLLWHYIDPPQRTINQLC